MAKLLDTISADLISAQKNKDEVVVSTLRLLISEIKNAQIAKRAELVDDEILEQIQKAAKRRRESIEAYEKAQRSDLADKERAELEVLNKYLPPQMSDAEISKIVDEVISATGASGVGDTGKVMGQVMAKVKGEADGNVVSKIVKEKLSA